MAPTQNQPIGHGRCIKHPRRQRGNGRRVRRRDAHNDSGQRHHKAESSPGQFTAADPAYQPDRRIACLQNPGALHPKARCAARLGKSPRSCRQQEKQHHVPTLQQNCFRRKASDGMPAPSDTVGNRQPGGACCFVLVKCNNRHENDCNPRKNPHRQYRSKSSIRCVFPRQ